MCVSVAWYPHYPRLYHYQEVPWQNTDSAGQLRVIHNTRSRLEDQLPTYLHLRPYVEGQLPNQSFTLLQLMRRLVM